MEFQPNTLRIVLVGKTDAGKSSTGNTICGRRVFKTKSMERGITFGSIIERGTFHGHFMTIVDTPGLFDPSKTNEELKREIANGVALAAPGPHMLLVVIRPGKFTNEEQEAVHIIQRMFGEDASQYTMALFTHGDDLEADGDLIEDVIQQSLHLSTFISQCGGGYHVFNNRDQDPSQVRELLEMIRAKVRENGGSYYTTEMLKKTETAIQEEDSEERRRQKERKNPFLETVSIAASTFTAVGFAIGRSTGAKLIGGAVAVAGLAGRADGQAAGVAATAAGRAAGRAAGEAVALARTAEIPVAGVAESASQAGRAAGGYLRSVGQTIVGAMQGTVGGAVVAGLLVGLTVAGVGVAVTKLSRRKKK